MSRRIRAAAAAAALASALSGCAALGVIDDGTSVSVGQANGGGVRNPARLPDDGDGWRVPARWAERGLRYGTDELVELLIDVSRRVALETGGHEVTVADLSPRRGGGSRWHRSHQSGRDVDLVLFATDAAGKPVAPDDMRHFGPDGKTTDDAEFEGKGWVFDVERNWLLVRALVEYRWARVQRIFLFQPLIEQLLAHAAARGEPEALIERAALILTQPGDSAPHDDHMHVRIVCSPQDRAYGCVDYGQLLPDMREELGVTWAMLPPPVRTAVLAPMPAMLALVGLRLLR
jgi:penicillin-insensitive murein endopeptidase